jgi:predicted O-methyltransferase YrrM
LSLSELAGLIPTEVGETLSKYAALAEYPIVEVGSYKGKSTCYLASATKQTVYAVDPWDLVGNPAGRFGFTTARDDFDLQTKPYPNIVPIQGFSVKIAETWDHGSVGLLFVDGDHSEQAVYNDVLAWMKYLVSDAVVILDDLDTPKNPGVRRAAERLRRMLGDFTVEAERLAIWRL